VIIHPENCEIVHLSFIQVNAAEEDYDEVKTSETLNI
jgi:hypothetical protein